MDTNSNQHRTRLRKYLVAGSVLTALILIWVCWPSDAWFARRQLRAELMSISASPETELERLSGFVKLGDHIDTVRKKLTDPPTSEMRGVNKNTYWSLGLDGVNLELAITQQGRVVGIGRYIWAQDEEVVWYKSAWWPDRVAAAH